MFVFSIYLPSAVLLFINVMSFGRFLVVYRRPFVNINGAGPTYDTEKTRKAVKLRSVSTDDGEMEQENSKVARCNAKYAFQKVKYQ